MVSHLPAFSRSRPLFPHRSYLIFLSTVDMVQIRNYNSSLAPLSPRQSLERLYACPAVSTFFSPHKTRNSYLSCTCHPVFAAERRTIAYFSYQLELRVYRKTSMFGARLGSAAASSCTGRLGGVQGQLGMSQKPLPSLAFFNNECIVYGKKSPP